jgi:hypothetical protein
MPVFSVARGDQMQVRAGFNGWDCNDPTDCVMTRTPGTNIFSLAANVTGFPNTESEFKYYLELDSSSIEVLNTTYGVIYDGIGWEDPPQFGGGNRNFILGADDGTDLLELELAGYYDLPAGGVIPAGQTVAVTFTVEMTNAEALGFNAAEDSVYLSVKDRWLKYLQGLGDDYKVIATENEDGTYSASPSFTGPFAWHMIYNWGFYDVSELAYVEEGGGFGFGRSRTRYQHANANDNCSWGDYTFPEDTWQSEPPLPVEEFNPDSICILLAGIGRDIVPDNFFLTNNYPNPFNPTTSFSFGITSTIEVKISIYNILGQKIFAYSKGKLDAGTYEFNWNGVNQIGDQVTSGIYFYEMEAGDQFREIKKMTLLK